MSFPIVKSIIFVNICIRKVNFQESKFQRQTSKHTNFHIYNAEYWFRLVFSSNAFSLLHSTWFPHWWIACLTILLVMHAVHLHQVTSGDQVSSISWAECNKNCICGLAEPLALLMSISTYRWTVCSSAQNGDRKVSILMTRFYFDHVCRVLSNIFTLRVLGIPYRYKLPWPATKRVETDYTTKSTL